MALHILATNDVVLARYAGSDSQINDAENVMWYIYSAGLIPSPGGLTIKDFAPVAGTFWGTFWHTFQTTEFTWLETDLGLVTALTPVAPDRYKIVKSDRWTTFGTIQGTVLGAAAPAFLAYSVRKVTSAPGRGRQGHIRIPGVPVANEQANLVSPIPLLAMNVALGAPNALNVPFGGGFTDQLIPVVMNGRLVNTTPGHPPVFYSDFIDAFVASNRMGSQITRKFGRHRS